MSNGFSEFTLDFTPDTHMLLSGHVSRLGWKRCIGELVDNSLDAKANTISIKFGKKSMQISDDGVGIQDLQSALKLGAHQDHPSTALGRYGVGLKDAALWLWGETRVCTCRGGKIRRTMVKWDSFQKSSKWAHVGQEYDATPETCAENEVPLTHGTTIAFTNIAKQFTEFDAIVKELGYVFAPAIKKGRSIIIGKGKSTYPIEAFEPPPLEHVIDIEREINGKKYRLHAGVVPEGTSNERNGFTLAYRHRVITRTNEGCGHYGSARFFGWVDLDSKWKLSRHKDELVEDAELLAKSLQYECTKQLRLASEQAKCVSLSGIESAVQNALQGAMESAGKKKAKRNPKENNTGAIEPQKTSRVHRRASKTQDGIGSIIGKVGGKIALRLERGLGIECVGRTEINSESIGISLSLDHPCVKVAAESDNNLALLVLAASVLAIHGATTQNEKERNKLLAFKQMENDHENFMKALAVYVSHIETEEAIADSQVPCEESVA